MSQLGVILTPYGQVPGAYPSEIGYSYGGNGTYLCPEDPYHNTRGERGFYYDTQLGSTRKQGFFARLRQRKINRALSGLGRSVPDDFDAASYYQYTPVSDGWVAAKEGFQPGGWIPPDGWNPAGAYGSQMHTPGLGGLRDATVDPTATATPGPTVIDNQTLAALVQTMQDKNTKLFILSIISTTAVALSALITTIRNAKLIKQERRLLDEEEALIAAHG